MRQIIQGKIKTRNSQITSRDRSLNGSCIKSLSMNIEDVIEDDTD